MDSQDFPIADTEYGPVKGVKIKSALETDYLSFRGIPYMKAPLGKLRFREAHTPRNWSDPYDATEEGPAFCMTDFMTGLQDGQENAGTINVYTKDLKPDKLRPVMVWVRSNNFSCKMKSKLFYLRFMAADIAEVQVERTFTVPITFSKKMFFSSPSTIALVQSAF